MSKLATGLVDIKTAPGGQKGPRGACYGVYKSCDQEDFQAVTRLRDEGFTWQQIQAEVDSILKVTEPIPQKKFVYHWRQQCTCWRDSK